MSVINDAVANPQSKEQAVLNKRADALLGYFMDQGPRMQLQTGVKMGWTRLYGMAGVSTLSSAIIANNDWLKDAKNQDQLRRFLREPPATVKRISNESAAECQFLLVQGVGKYDWQKAEPD
jgi:hypothetical protein